MEDNFYKGKSAEFFKFYRIYIAVVTVLLIGVLVFLWVKLSGFQKDFEKGNLEQLADGQADSTLSDEERERIAQLCFENYVGGLKMDDYVNLWYEANPTHFDSEESVKNFISESIINSNTERYKAPDFSLQAPLYYIVADKEPLMSVALAANGNDYSVDKAQLLFKAEEVFSIEIPANCTFCVNGTDVSEEYKSGEPQAVIVDDYDEELVNPAMIDTYIIDNLIALPDEGAIKVKCDDLSLGASLSVDGKYYASLDTVSGIEYQNKADDFIKSLLGYYTKGKENAESNMKEVLSHVASGSKAYKVINDSYSGIVWTTADNSINYGVRHSDVYVLADNCYCVDVDYRDENSIEASKTGGVYRVYFLDDGDGFHIVNFAGIK